VQAPISAGNRLIRAAAPNVGARTGSGPDAQGNPTFTYHGKCTFGGGWPASRAALAQTRSAGWSLPGA